MGQKVCVGMSRWILVFPFWCVRVWIKQTSMWMCASFVQCCWEVKRKWSRKGTRKQSILLDVAQKTHVKNAHVGAHSDIAPVRKTPNPHSRFLLFTHRDISSKTFVPVFPGWIEMQRHTDSIHTHTHTHLVTLTFTLSPLPEKCSNLSNIRGECWAVMEHHKTTPLK